MGIGIVLLFWAVLGTILAGLGLLIFGGATAHFTRGVKEGRRRAIVLASIFPFLCLGWAGAVFLFQAVVNEVVLHRDPGLGDDWHCPLPNGFALMMIDVTDYGWVYNPKTQEAGGGIAQQDDAIFGVRTVQVSGRYIFGGLDSKIPDEDVMKTDNEHVDSYFFIDTQTGQRSGFTSYSDLRDAVLKLGIQLNLQPIDEAYRRYRFTRFDIFVAFLLFVPPILAAGFLLNWIAKLRRTQENISQFA
jgi:hypothetical protein